MKRTKVTRRNFLKGGAFITGSAAGTGLFVASNPELEAAPAPRSTGKNRKTAIAQCPYCGVGCGTIIQAENGKIVSMRPDKDHPTNYGLQCIKGLTAAEPIYVDRMKGDPYVRKDVWKEWKKPGHGDLEFISKTKGSFDSKHRVVRLTARLRGITPNLPLISGFVSVVVCAEWPAFYLRLR